MARTEHLETRAPSPARQRGDGRRFEAPAGSEQENVGGAERFVSVASGSVLALFGAGRRDLPGWLIAGAGAALIYRGLTGHCPVYEALGLDTAREQPERRWGGLARSTGDRRHGVCIAQSMLIDRSPEELYAFWRNFENLPQALRHLEWVRTVDDHRSHWVAKAPAFAGGTVEWDAEIVEDEPNACIAWRSLPEADVENRGSVQFVRAPGARGTRVRVTVEYRPPGGQLGRWGAKLFGEEPEQQIWDDLRNLKRLMEVGEILTTQGQPQGTCLSRGSLGGRPREVGA